uniref:RING-type domain-containing protein n=1 Tax=Zea mays TaxID=4577 RepID=A0A804PDC0_MAIZE
MQAFLSSLSKCEEGHNNQTEDWMKQIWDVAYDIEDCIDDFAHSLRACNLCNGGIRFVRDKHPNRSIRDMPLQIESRRELLQRSGRSPDGISSVILVEKDRSFIKSKVVIRIMEYLNLFEIHGIIRKTRTVMECLHRFCRDCIDKSMRLGNNECPACRTHCASRRSLRDDPNYDALIAALYPDIDKYEEE